MPRGKKNGFTNKLKRKASDLVDNIRDGEKKQQGRSRANQGMQGSSRSASGRSAGSRSSQQRSRTGSQRRGNR